MVWYAFPFLAKEGAVKKRDAKEKRRHSILVQGEFRGGEEYGSNPRAIDLRDCQSASAL